MINKPLDQIDLDDLKQLQANAVAEGKTIEYKRELPTDSDSSKKEFLADISSFANASGGDLIFGIAEKGGVTKSIDGLDVENIDEAIPKYENMIRDGIEPRIASVTRSIKISEKKFILIFRINRSWLGPHRVIYKGHDKFYSRHSTGKYPLDTAELRTAFTLSQTLTEQIMKFKTERILQVFSDNLPVPFHVGSKIVLHLTPLESFSPQCSVDLQPIIKDPLKLKPIALHIKDYAITFEGVLSYDHDTNYKSKSYVRLYWKGIFEAVVFLPESLNNDKKVIPSRWYEEQLLESLKSYLNLAKELGINTPMVIFLTLIGVKGWRMSDDYAWLPVGRKPAITIDREILQLPETIVESYDTKPEDILRPMFDRIWNACGYERSKNFDEDGNWTKQN